MSESSKVIGSSRNQGPSSASEEPSEYVVINYPGIVKNVTKAIESLGGENIVNVVRILSFRSLFITYRHFLVLFSN